MVGFIRKRNEGSGEERGCWWHLEAWRRIIFFGSGGRVFDRCGREGTGGLIYGCGGKGSLTCRNGKF
jgi:hypothetical protein